jgi:hypothetical protein
MPELDVDFLGADSKVPPSHNLNSQLMQLTCRLQRIVLLESSIAPVRYPFKCLWTVAENSLEYRCVVPEINDIAWNIVLWRMLFLATGTT